jgi:hypothetical protein
LFGLARNTILVFSVTAASKASTSARYSVSGAMTISAEAPRVMIG